MKFLLALSLTLSLTTGAIATGSTADESAQDSLSPVDLELLESASFGDRNGVLQALRKNANIHAKVSSDYVESSAYDGPLTFLVANKTALVIAVEKQFASIVKVLLEHGANTQDRDEGILGGTVLGIAVDNDNHEIVSLLLQHGADANNSGSSNFLPLGKAIGNDNVEMVRLLLEHGADPNAHGELGKPPLHEAAFVGGLTPSLFGSKHALMMSILLQYQADPNLNTGGGTPLMTAAKVGFRAGAKILLRHGVDIEATDNKGNTALILAAREEDGAGIVNDLLKAGANVNAVNNAGNSALHAAVEQDNRNEKADKVVKVLLGNNANPNLVNANGDTALHLAADNILFPSPKSVEYLLKAGAKHDAVNKSGATALELAIRLLKSAKKYNNDIKQHAAIVRMLRTAAE